MSQGDFLQLIPIIQSAVNNATSPQKKNVAPVTDFTTRPHSTLIFSFLRTAYSVYFTIGDVQRERVFNFTFLISRMDELHLFVENSVAHNCVRMRNGRQKG